MAGLLELLSMAQKQPQTGSPVSQWFTRLTIT